MIKFFYRYSVFLSLLFLLIVLFKLDYLKIPNVFSAMHLTASITFLFAGFIFHAISWKNIMSRSDYPITLNTSIASVGLSIFGKYIPGKVWMIMGRSTYVSMNTNYPIGQLSLLSLHAQFIAIWIGLLLGFTGIIIIEGLNYLGLTCLLSWFLLTAVIFTHITQNSIKFIVKKLLKKDISFPRLSFISTLSTIPWFGIYWILWSIGFYFFVSSLSSSSVPLITALGFPLASAIGIIIVIMPGGLAIREGVLATYLHLVGLSFPEAASIAIAARLWFIAGEFFIFIVGWISHRQMKEKSDSF